MYYSLDDLRQGVRYKADHSQNSRIQNDELDEYINDGIDMAQSIIFPLKEEYFVRRMYRNIVSGTTSYRLPENSRGLIGVDLSSDNGTTYYQVRERDIDRRNTANQYYYAGAFPYSFYFERNHMIFLAEPTSASTNGVRFLYSWQHWDLDDSTTYDIAFSNIARSSNAITGTVAATDYIEEEQLITLKSSSDASLDGQYRITDITGTTVTLYDEEKKPDIAAGETSTMKARYSMDLPGGRMTRRYVEEWASFSVLDRDNRDTSKAERKIGALASKLKKNLNQRHRGRLKKVRQRGTYSGAALTPYTRGN